MYQDFSVYQVYPMQAAVDGVFWPGRPEQYSIDINGNGILWLLDSYDDEIGVCTQYENDPVTTYPGDAEVPVSDVFGYFDESVYYGNHSIDFDGVDDAVAFNLSGKTDVTNWTMAFWLRPDQAASGGLETPDSRIVYIGNPAVSAPQLFVLLESGELVFGYDHDGTITESWSLGAVEPDKWVHFSIMHEWREEPKDSGIYHSVINAVRYGYGMEQLTVEPQSSLRFCDIATNDVLCIKLGQEIDSTGSYGGLMQDFRLLDCTLSSAKSYWLYNYGSGTTDDVLYGDLAPIIIKFSNAVESGQEDYFHAYGEQIGVSFASASYDAKDPWHYRLFLGGGYFGNDPTGEQYNPYAFRPGERVTVRVEADTQAADSAITLGQPFLWQYYIEVPKGTGDFPLQIPLSTISDPETESDLASAIAVVELDNQMGWHLDENDDGVIDEGEWQSYDLQCNPLEIIIGQYGAPNKICISNQLSSDDQKYMDDLVQPEWDTQDEVWGPNSSYPRLNGQTTDLACAELSGSEQNEISSWISDVVVVDDGGQNYIYMGTYLAKFAHPTSVDVNQFCFAARIPFGSGTDASQAVALGDLDGNGHVDIVVGNALEQDLVYYNIDGIHVINNSTPQDKSYDIETAAAAFGDPVGFGPINSNTHALEIADVNNDGLLDIIAGDASGVNRIYLNTGDQDNRFSDSSNGSSVITFGSSGDITEDLAVGDFDNNNYVDIAVANYGQPSAIYLNDGNLGFTESELTDESGVITSYFSTSIVIADIDAVLCPDTCRKSLDLILGNGEGQQSCRYINDGHGHFTNAGPMERELSDMPDTRALAALDFDLDGSMDIIMANTGVESKVCLQGASLLFSPSTVTNPGYIYDWEVELPVYMTIPKKNPPVETISDIMPRGATDGNGHWMFLWDTSYQFTQFGSTGYTPYTLVKYYDGCNGDGDPWSDLETDPDTLWSHPEYVKNSLAIADGYSVEVISLPPHWNNGPGISADIAADGHGNWAVISLWTEFNVGSDGRYNRGNPRILVQVADEDDLATTDDWDCAYLKMPHAVFPSVGNSIGDPDYTGYSLTIRGVDPYYDTSYTSYEPADSQITPRLYCDQGEATSTWYILAPFISEQGDQDVDFEFLLLRNTTDQSNDLDPGEWEYMAGFPDNVDILPEIRDGSDNITGYRYYPGKESSYAFSADDSGRCLLVWVTDKECGAEGENEQVADIFFTYSSDYGETWTDPWYVHPQVFTEGIDETIWETYDTDWPANADVSLSTDGEGNWKVVWASKYADDDANSREWTQDGESWDEDADFTLRDYDIIVADVNAVALNNFAAITPENREDDYTPWNNYIVLNHDAFNDSNLFEDAANQNRPSGWGQFDLMPSIEYCGDEIWTVIWKRISCNYNYPGGDLIVTMDESVLALALTKNNGEDWVNGADLIWPQPDDYAIHPHVLSFSKDCPQENLRFTIDAARSSCALFSDRKGEYMVGTPISYAADSDAGMELPVCYQDADIVVLRSPGLMDGQSLPFVFPELVESEAPEQENLPLLNVYYATQLDDFPGVVFTNIISASSEDIANIRLPDADEPTDAFWTVPDSNLDSISPDSEGTLVFFKTALDNMDGLDRLHRLELTLDLYRADNCRYSVWAYRGGLEQNQVNAYDVWDSAYWDRLGDEEIWPMIYAGEQSAALQVSLTSNFNYYLYTPVGETANTITWAVYCERLTDDTGNSNSGDLIVDHLGVKAYFRDPSDPEKVKDVLYQTQLSAFPTATTAELIEATSEERSRIIKSNEVDNPCWQVTGSELPSGSTADSGTVLMFHTSLRDVAHLERLNQIDLAFRIGRDDSGDLDNISPSAIDVRIFKGKTFQDDLAAGTATQDNLWDSAYWQTATADQDLSDACLYSVELAQDADLGGGETLDLQELINVSWFQRGEGFEQLRDTLTWAIYVEKVNSNDENLMLDVVHVDTEVDDMPPPDFNATYLTFRSAVTGETSSQLRAEFRLNNIGGSTNHQFNFIQIEMEDYMDQIYVSGQPVNNGMILKVVDYGGSGVGIQWKLADEIPADTNIQRDFIFTIDNGWDYSGLDQTLRQAFEESLLNEETDSQSELDFYASNVWLELYYDDGSNVALKASGRLDVDWDDDGLTNFEETRVSATEARDSGDLLYSDPYTRDTDRDGLLDGEERLKTLLILNQYTGSLWPSKESTDRDTLTDGREIGFSLSDVLDRGAISNNPQTENKTFNYSDGVTTDDHDISVDYTPEEVGEILDHDRPSAPQNLNAVYNSSGDGSIDLYWDAHPEEENITYNLYRQASDDDETMTQIATGLTAAATESTPYSDSSDLEAGVQYDYWVAAQYDDYGVESDLSDKASATVPE